MRLADLEKELAARGFTHVRNGRHRIYRHQATGRTLTITAHCGGRWGHDYCRTELAHIRRTIARLLADDNEQREAS